MVRAHAERSTNALTVVTGLSRHRYTVKATFFYDYWTGISRHLLLCMTVHYRTRQYYWQGIQGDCKPDWESLTRSLTTPGPL
jgi:hypothetical protein